MFIERMNEKEKARLYQAAAEGAELLDKLGHPWWLSHGTLLGAWRHKGVIPWDDDLDFAFPRERLDELKGLALAMGWGFARNAPFAAKIWNSRIAMYQTDKAWSWPFVDIALYDEAWDRIIIEHAYHYKFQSFQRDEILPTQSYAFGPLSLPLPKSPKLILNRLYPEWSTMPTSSYYSHRQERDYSEPAEKMLIQELNKKFEMFNLPK